MSSLQKPFIRLARSGEEAAIHDAHMRSIREVCIKDHGQEEIKGWGYRPLSNRWTQAIELNQVYVVESEGEIFGVGYIVHVEREGGNFAYLNSLYFTPEVLGLGLAKSMLSILISMAKSWQVNSIRLDSTITAYGFYKRHGFQDSGEVRKVEIGGSPVTCYPMEMQI